MIAVALSYSKEIQHLPVTIDARYIRWSFNSSPYSPTQGSIVEDAPQPSPDESIIWTCANSRGERDKLTGGWLAKAISE